MWKTVPAVPDSWYIARLTGSTWGSEMGEGYWGSITDLITVSGPDTCQIVSKELLACLGSIGAAQEVHLTGPRAITNVHCGLLCSVRCHGDRRERRQEASGDVTWEMSLGRWQWHLEKEGTLQDLVRGEAASCEGLVEEGALVGLYRVWRIQKGRKRSHRKQCGEDGEQKRTRREAEAFPCGFSSENPF